MMIRKTPAMKRVEDREGMTFDEILMEGDIELLSLADSLGISITTLVRWMEDRSWSVARIAVCPGDLVVAVDQASHERILVDRRMKA